MQFTITLIGLLASTVIVAAAPLADADVGAIQAREITEKDCIESCKELGVSDSKCKALTDPEKAACTLAVEMVNSLSKGEARNQVCSNGCHLGFFATA